jgi:hypothetical protein
VGSCGSEPTTRAGSTFILYNYAVHSIMLLHPAHTSRRLLSRRAQHLRATDVRSVHQARCGWYWRRVLGRRPWHCARPCACATEASRGRGANHRRGGRVQVAGLALVPLALLSSFCSRGRPTPVDRSRLVQVYIPTRHARSREGCSACAIAIACYVY